MTWARPSEAESMENGPHPQPCLLDPDQQVTAPTLRPTPTENQLGTPRPPQADRGPQGQKLPPTPSPTTMASISPWLITTHGWTVTRAPRHRPGPGSSPQENSTTRSASTPAPTSSCSRKSDTCRAQGQHRHLPEGWAGRGQVLKNRREIQGKPANRFAGRKDRTNGSRCWQPHSNHLREQRGKFSNLAEGVSALAVQQNHFGKKKYMHGQAQPKLLSKNL